MKKTEDKKQFFKSSTDGKTKKVLYSITQRENS